MTTGDKALTAPSSATLREASRAIEPVRVSPQAVEAARQDIAILQELVGTLLEAEFDYGAIPGVQGKALFDPGAAKLMAGFNCYSTHSILVQRDDGETMTFIIEAQLISRATQQVVATGVGAASTKETKWAYRWVSQREAQVEGYTGEALKGLKRRDRTGQSGSYSVYRIPNPDLGELLNTLVKMAAKRAEQDAVRSLPGVGTALAKLFANQLAKTNGYAHFWAEVRRLGFSDTEAHELLGVKSLKDWEDSGKNLEDALGELRKIRIEQEHTGGASESRGDVVSHDPNSGSSTTPKTQQPPLAPAPPGRSQEAPPKPETTPARRVSLSFSGPDALMKWVEERGKRLPTWKGKTPQDVFEVCEMNSWADLGTILTREQLSEKLNALGQKLIEKWGE